MPCLSAASHQLELCPAGLVGAELLGKARVAKALAGTLEGAYNALRNALSKAETALAVDSAGSGHAQELDAAILVAEAAGVPADDASLGSARQLATVIATKLAPPTTQPARPPAAPAVASASNTSRMEAEWRDARRLVDEAEQVKRAGGRGAQQVSMLVSQVARVHHVVWEKAGAIVQCLTELQSQGRDALIAGAARKSNELHGVGICKAMLRETAGQVVGSMGFLLVFDDRRTPKMAGWMGDLVWFASANPFSQ